MNLFRRLVLSVSALVAALLVLAAAGTNTARAEVPYVTQIVRDLASGENGRVWSDPERGDAFGWEPKEAWSDKLDWLVSPDNDDWLNVEVFIVQVDYNKAKAATDTDGGYTFADMVEIELRQHEQYQDRNLVIVVLTGDSLDGDSNDVDGVRFFCTEECDTLPPSFTDDLEGMTEYVDQLPETTNDPEALVGLWVDGLIELAEYYHEGAEPQNDPTDEATTSDTPTASPSPTASEDTRTPAEVRGHTTEGSGVGPWILVSVVVAGGFAVLIAWMVRHRS